MSAIDMTKVAGLQAVDTEGQIIGTLSVDDLTELVAANLVQSTKNEIVKSRSAALMSEASTLAATDEYEDQLPQDANPAFVRTMDSAGNPKQTAIGTLASVVGGLLPVATTEKNGLYPSTEVKKTQRVNSLSPGQIVDTGLKSGLIVIGSSITSGSAVFCFGFNITNRTDLVASEAFNIDNLYVYKESNIGNILIKNNRSDTPQVWYSIVSGY